MEKTKKRFSRYLLPVIFGAVILGLIAYVIVLDTQKQNYKRQLVGFYEKSYEDMVTNIGSLETKLSKLGISNSNTMTSVLLMDVWRQTGDTESSIANLPVSATQSAPFTQFINRLGDYCRYLSSKIANGDKISDADIAQLAQLKKSCGELSTNLNDVWNNGYVSKIEMSDAAYYIDDNAKNIKNKNTQGIDFTNQQYPRLQYDGPFSESTENKKPLGLLGNQIDRETGKQKAVAFLGKDYVTSINFTSDLDGSIPAYSYDGTSADGNFSIYITKQGGNVLYYNTDTGSSVQAVPTDERYAELVNIAIQYFKEKGYPDMKASYAQFYNGMALINLAPVEKDVVLYPDLVKAWVDIEKNKVVGIDTRNYLMSHVTRNLPDIKIKQEEAQKKLSARLSVQSSRLALIPTDQQKEKLCWEFTCKSDGTDFIVYIDTMTGNEDDILEIQHTNEGTLVM